MIDRLRTLSPGRQLLMALLGVVVLTGLLLAAWALLRVPYRPLFTRLKASEAGAIVADLDRKKIPYALTDGGSTILVPANRLDATRLDLTNDNLTLKGTVGFELFNKSDMGLTDFAQRINYQRALQGELERTIMTLDGVDTARVHLSLGEDRIFREDRVSPKASVTVRMKDEAVLDGASAAGIARLVAAAVPQLQAADVVILDEKGAIVSAPQPPVVAAAGAGDEGEAVGAFYAARIRAALTPLAGETVRVEVRAAVPAEGNAAAASTALFDPADRTVPLEVHLTPAAPLDPVIRQQVEAAASQAIGFAPDKGDTISFDTTVPARSEMRRALPFAAAAPAGAGTEQGSALSEGIPWIYGASLALVLAIGALAALAMRARRGPQPLSPSERTRLAARLTHLIDQEEPAHAPEA